MAESSSNEYVNEMYEILDDKESTHIEQVYVLCCEDSDVDTNENDELFDKEGNFLADHI